MIVQGSNLFMGNIGDSRAILGSKDSNDTMVATQLTVDLKPDLPSTLNNFSHCFVSLWCICVCLNRILLSFVGFDRGS